MKNKKENKINTEAAGLDDVQERLIRSRVDELEDRSKIPRPQKKVRNPVLRFAKKKPLAAAVIGTLAVSLITCLVLITVYLVNLALGAKNTDDYIFHLGEEEIVQDYDEIVIDDTLYVDMSLISDFAELTVSGSEETKKYLVNNEQYMKFIDKSAYAIINARAVEISPPAIVSGGKCFVPYKILTKIIATGITFEIDVAGNEVFINRETYESGDMLYKTDITFTADNLLPYSSHAPSQPTQQSSKYTYTTDVSPYLKYITAKNLLLVNRDNPLGESYTPASLQKLPSGLTRADKDYYLESDAAASLVAMMAEMRADNSCDVYVTSAYRTYSYQKNLFEKYVKEYMQKGYTREDAISLASQTSAQAGYSEHQSGLCVDFITNSMSELTNEGFEKSAAFEWLSKNAYKFGFIMRYPEDKVGVTGYSYESWHYRFVGRDAATEIYFSGICLEEYLEIVG